MDGKIIIDIYAQIDRPTDGETNLAINRQIDS